MYQTWPMKPLIPPFTIYEHVETEDSDFSIEDMNSRSYMYQKFFQKRELSPLKETPLTYTLETVVHEVPVTVHYTFENGDSGTRDTQPMPDQVTIVKVMHGKTDVTSFVSEMGYDDLLEEECLEDHSQPLED